MAAATASAAAMPSALMSARRSPSESANVVSPSLVVRGERQSGAGGLEESVFAGGDIPAFGRDGDELAGGIGKVEEDLAGDGIGAAGTDATPDGEALVVAGVVRLSFEVIEDGLEGVGGGDEIEFGEALVEEPMAIGGRAEREDIESAGEGFGETDESLAVTGRERDAAPGDPEEIR
jgi:hypothetical protein